MTSTHIVPLYNKDNTRHEDFWMDNYKELYQNNNYINFFPRI